LLKRKLLTSLAPKKILQLRAKKDKLNLFKKELQAKKDLTVRPKK